MGFEVFLNSYTVYETTDAAKARLNKRTRKATIKIFFNIYDIQSHTSKVVELSNVAEKDKIEKKLQKAQKKMFFQKMVQVWLPEGL